MKGKTCLTVRSQSPVDRTFAELSEPRAVKSENIAMLKNKTAGDFNDFNYEIKKIVNEIEMNIDEDFKIDYLKRLVCEGTILLDYSRLIEEKKIIYDDLKIINPTLNEKFLRIIKGMESGSAKCEKEFYEYYEQIERVCELLKVEIKKADALKLKRHKKGKKNKDLPAIKIKSSLSDIVRIFEAMKNGGIISTKTEVKQIADIFFSAPKEQIPFEKKYNATKNRIEKFGSASNSKELLIFVKGLIKASFYQKERALDELSRQIFNMQRNII